MNLVYGLALHEFSVTQWIEHPPSVREVIGSNPGGTQIFSLSHSRDMPNISSSHLFNELKIYHLSFFSPLLYGLLINNRVFSSLDWMTPKH